MVMLLLDFEKAYDRVEWGFLDGSLLSLGFNQIWISWIRALYIDSWCVVGLSGQTSDPFKLTRSIRQGCPLAPFLYLSVADCLGYLLDQDETIQGLLLPGQGGVIKDQEYADNTNLYLKDSIQNLNNTKLTLETFSLASGAKINWNKSTAIWAATSPRPFIWGDDVGLRWLLPGEIVRYLGFSVGFQVPSETRFESVLQAL
jgi:hypothetical protein